MTEPCPSLSPWFNDGKLRTRVHCDLEQGHDGDHQADTTTGPPGGRDTSTVYWAEGATYVHGWF
jgi:hypothetical protein